MLKLKKVELIGFKSFCDRTEMVFNGAGITAVVGPNGCGKSNISDAISWVLGEQSAKSLRGGTMQDVIFNGTRDRRPTGFAEVSLTLADTDYHAEDCPPLPGTVLPGTVLPGTEQAARAAAPSTAAGTPGTPSYVLPSRPAEEPSFRPSAPKVAPKVGPEVVICRRLFRSGESEYLLDGRPSRLRDIQELFWGTGLGHGSYAIIEQGKIGQILNAKPYERRALIEEAAGISKYKNKRRLAEAKLESSKQNLNRVNDILEEVTRQVNSLKRQASKARRYAELREEFRGRLRAVLSSRHAEMERQAVQSALELSLASNRSKEMGAQVEALEQEHIGLNRAGYQQEEALRHQRDRIASLEMEADRARNRISYQQQQAKELETRLREQEARQTQLGTRLESLERELVECRAGLAAAEAEEKMAQAEVEGRAAELSRTEQQLHSRESELDNLRASVLARMGELAELRNQLTQVEEYLAGLQRQGERGERELTAAAEEQAGLRKQQGALLAKKAQQQLDLQYVNAERAGVETRLGELKVEVRRVSGELEQLRGEYADVRARRDSLEQILSHRAYTAEAVKKLFASNGEGNMRLPEGFRPLGILADFLEAEPRFETVVEDFLVEELEYVVVKSWEAAQEGVHLLRSEGEGRATFLVHPEAPLPLAGNGLDSLPPGLTPLKDFVRLTNGLPRAAETLLPRLALGYVADSAAAARELALAHPQCYFLAPEGECFHGSTLTGGKRAGTGPLGLKRELRQVTQKAGELARHIDASAAGLRASEEEAARIAASLEKLRGDEVEREKLGVGLDQELRQLAGQLARAAERLSVARLELQRLEQERARAAEHAERLRSEAEGRERARQELEARLSETTVAAAELGEARISASAALAEARARAAALQERRSAAAAATVRLDDLVVQERAQAGELESQLNSGRQELKRLAHEQGELERRAAEAVAGRAAAEQAADELQKALEEGRQRLAGLEEQTRRARAELDEQRERKSAAEVALARQQSDLGHLGELCRNDLGLALEELAADPAELLADEALAQAEEQARQLRARIEAMGPVNMMALEEYQEARQRQEFLDAQRQDLLDAIRDTQQTIQEIEAVSRRQFLEAFQAINANFQETFRTLFGGGTGMMKLSEEENLSESGVDLIAQPPGKRLQNVLLLSGGEKALAAMALVLSIFQYQPSPFCVLDEVDAPLDDANIGRFTRLVEQMTPNTQFIIITHSKKTMEASPALYGVTMEEPGVSKLVSVKLGQTELDAVSHQQATPRGQAVGAIA